MCRSYSTCATLHLGPSPLRNDDDDEGKYPYTKGFNTSDDDVEISLSLSSPAARARYLHPTYPPSTVTMRMPCDVGDYTDFYTSKEHAHNVGCIFRGGGG